MMNKSNRRIIQIHYLPQPFQHSCTNITVLRQVLRTLQHYECSTKKPTQQQCVSYLSVNPPGELRLGHHDDDPEHSEDQGVVAQPLPLLEERPPVAQLVADVLVLLLRRVARLPGQALAGRLAGVLAVALGDHHLQAGAVQGLEGLGLGVELRKVSPRRAQAAQGSHHTPIVLAAVHGYLRERATALCEGGLGSSMA